MAAYKEQVSDARLSSELFEISQTCPNSAQFLHLLNRAQRRLMRRGAWFDTEQLVKFCVYDRCLTLPEYAATLTGLRVGGCAPSNILNHWYAIDQPWGDFTRGVVGRERGMGPTYNSIASATGSMIRYHVLKQADIGKTLTLYGTQFGGQPLMEKDADGNWREGLTITAAAPYAQTSVLVTSITSVVRQATQGMTYLYEVYDSTTNPVTLRALATYGPNETNPRYRQYMLENFCCVNGCEDANGRRISSVEAMVKLAWVPLVNEWDFLLIDNYDALALMIQAIQYEKAGDYANSELFIRKSVNEMNLEDRVRQPEDQLVISVNTSSPFQNLM